MTASAVASAPQETREERRLILLLSLGAFGSAASMRVVDAQLPDLAQEFNVSLAATAQIITVFALAYGALQLAYGPIGDRLGKWRVIAAAVIASGFTAAACAAAPGFGWLLAARALAGATCAAIIPLAMAWIGDAVDYERRQPVLARFITGQIFGMATGQWLGGAAADWAHWRVPFALLALWFFVTGVMLWRARGPAQAAAPGSGRGGHPLQEAAYVLSQPWARAILAVVFIEAVFLFGPFAFVPTHLHLVHGLTLSLAGTVVMLYAAGGLLFAVASRALVRRFGEAGLARGGGALLALGMLMLAFSPVWWTAPVACTVAGLGFYMLHNTLQTNATQMAPQARGAAVSLFAGAFFVGQTVGVGVTSLFVERSGTAPVLIACAFGLLILGVVFGRLRTQHHPAL